MLVPALPALAVACDDTVVFEDRDGDGLRDPGERPMAGVRVSDGRDIAVTGEDGRFRLPAAGDGRTVFAIKPAGFAYAPREDGLPDFWRNLRAAPGPALRYGGFPVSYACADIGLRREMHPAERSEGLRVLVFADPQPKSRVDAGYYERDIVDGVIADAAADVTNARRKPADLGLSLGDIVDDDLSLYPEMKRITARLGVPWLHVAGNHDLDFDAGSDEDSLLSFRHQFGPDTFAWEEPEANFVVLDDVIYLGEGRPPYIGGLREAQFAFLERYLADADRDRLLV
ncbi:MAG TPA: metallophosphoesterase N-terminal domain-containing protein, partial [Xanthomonadaceae bacterium]|nr:metallophosphoesterase N-terminal domain-containing protein [Xanthomonadaceae bacterium]